MKKIELMAPAGNLEILKAAIDYGADAVYLGVGAFNARMNADNFGFEELQEGVRYAKLRSSKVYLTLNTIVNSFEMEEAIVTAANAYDLGIDGIIIQDLGLAMAIHKQYPDIPLIASTQMNVFSVTEFQKLKDLGFKRVVFPRELSVDEIKKRNKLADKLNLETEVFAHGAICVCCSGLCLFSSMNKSGSRSGNRGLCAQPCRQEYKLSKQNTEIKSGHLLSPKDRSIIEYLSDIIESGTTSLKIEGRMRDVNYVKSTVKAYRTLIDAYYEGSLNNSTVKSVMNDLLVNFNRGGKFTSQYLSGNKQKDFLSGEYVGKFGLKLGIIRSSDSKKGTVTFTYNENLPLPSRGDYLSIRDGSNEICSFPIGKIHEMPKALAVKGLHPEMINKLKPDMSVYLMGHETELDKKDYRKTHISITVESGEDIISATARVVEGMHQEVFAEFDIDTEKEFDGNPLSIERVEAQMRKFGDTPFVVDEIIFANENEFSCKVSTINELRRGLVDNLISEIMFNNEHYLNNDFDDFFDFDKNEEEDSEEDYNDEGSITSMAYYPSFKMVESSLSLDYEWYAFSIYDLCVKAFRESITSFVEKNDKKLVVVMPDYYHDFVKKAFKDTMTELKNTLGDKLVAYIDSCIVNNGNDTDFDDSNKLMHFVSGGTNIYNNDTADIALDLNDGFYPSYELQTEEGIETMLKCKKKNDKYILLHSEGRIPWMQSDFCSIGAHQDKCRSCFDSVYYTLKATDDLKAEPTELYVLSRPIDCSSSIWGEAKNKYSMDDAYTLSEAGFNVINVDVII